METMTIGVLAKEAGVAAGTLRYYESLGLVAPSGRSRAGYRLYPRDEVRRLRFIRRAQELGFSLEEVAWLLKVHGTPSAQAAEVKRLTQEKLADIEGRIRDLERMRRGLKSLDDQCRGEGAATGCPILAALAGNDQIAADLSL